MWFYELVCMSHVPKYTQIGIIGKQNGTAFSYDVTIMFNISSLWLSAPLYTRNHPPFEPYNNKEFVSVQGVYFSCVILQNDTGL